jgi:alpha-methylacyl-CoA racemase
MLQGVKVLDFSRLLPGPYCSYLLAQLGAEVTKIEDPKGGDYARSLSPELFALVNRGKASVALDLRHPKALEVLEPLLAQTDVLLESFRPGVMERSNLGYAQLAARFPKLVYCSLTGYGQHSELSARAGHDINYMALSGAASQLGAVPTLSGIPLSDLAGGAQSAALGIVSALYSASRTGQGQWLDVAMLAGTLALQVTGLATLRATGKPPSGDRDALTGGLPTYGYYRCACGGFVAFGAVEAKFWLRFCEITARPDLLQLPLAMGERGAALRTALEQLFLSKTREQWSALLLHEDVCLTPVFNLHEALVQNPETWQLEAGKMVLNSPFGVGSPALAPAPRLGADTQARLLACGVSVQQLEAWRGAGLL